MESAFALSSGAGQLDSRAGGSVVLFGASCPPPNVFRLLLAAIATGRADYLRIVYVVPLFFFAFPLLLDARLVDLPQLSKLRPLLALYLVVSFAECFWFLSSRAAHASQVLATRRGLVRVE